MNYDDIMKDITSGLIGQAEDDMAYLRDKADEYKTHELSKEILRGIGRLLVEVIPTDIRNQTDRLINNDKLGTSTAIEEAEFQIYKKANRFSSGIR